MTDEEISLQTREIKTIISSMKYKLNFIDLKKIKFIKSKFKKSNQLVTLPSDIVTYTALIDTRIKTILKTMDKPHNNLQIIPMETEVTVFEAMSWIELTYNSLLKDLRVAYFINFKKYNKYAKRDINKNIEKSFKEVYKLQLKKLNSKFDFIVSIYSMIPTLLKNEREGE